MITTTSNAPQHLVSSGCTMSDDIDRASEREDRERAAAIAAHFQKAQAVHAVPQGYCLNCGEDFPDGSKKIYCDADCAEQHAAHLKRK